MRPGRTIHKSDRLLDISVYESSTVALKLSLNFPLQSCGKWQRTPCLQGADSGTANCYNKRMRPIMLLLSSFSSWWYVCTCVHACVGSLDCFSLVYWCVLPRKSPEWGGGRDYFSSWQSQPYSERVQCDLTDYHHSCVLHGAGRGVELNHLITIYFISPEIFLQFFFFFLLKRGSAVKTTL